MINRLITPSLDNSFFIFGARGTGKSTWIKRCFLAGKEHLYIDLLDPDMEEKYAAHPNELTGQALFYKRKKNFWIVIDEIQRVPKLLNLAHKCIEDHGTNFVLTGSSARKLKRGRSNLLAGRAFVHYLYPLTHAELGKKFDLEFAMSWGGLPKMRSYASENDRRRYLKSYTHTYLREEITAEQVVRNLEPFRHFLHVAAQHNGEIINYANIARDIGVQIPTVQSYFQILEDTHIGYLLSAYHPSFRKRVNRNPKFYFFDTGVKRSLDDTVTVPLKTGTYAFGKAFEHFIIAEMTALNDYRETDFRLNYMRTKDSAEVDLIIERPAAVPIFIEIKSADRVDERDVRTLRAMKKERGDKIEALCLSRDPDSKIYDGVRMLPWQDGFEWIFSGMSR